MEPFVNDYGLELDSQEARKERKEWGRKILWDATQERQYRHQKDLALTDIEMLIRECNAGSITTGNAISQIEAIVGKALTFPDPS